MASSALNVGEVARVVDLIRPCFDEYVARYNERKYPPTVYDQLLNAFRAPMRVTHDDIRIAILWKFGHLRKRRIPARHEDLISELQLEWHAIASDLAGSPAEVFERLAATAGGPNRYITVSFLLHLLRPTEIPIIDQHNFRAMNYYINEVRSGWRRKRKPSSYADLVTLSAFTKGVRSCWKTADPETAPSERALDRFLMMFGKSLKVGKRQSRSKPVFTLTTASRPAAEPARR